MIQRLLIWSKLETKSDRNDAIPDDNARAGSLSNRRAGDIGTDRTGHNIRCVHNAKPVPAGQRLKVSIGFISLCAVFGKEPWNATGQLPLRLGERLCYLRREYSMAQHYKEARLVPWDNGRPGISYVTSDGERGRRLALSDDPELPAFMALMQPADRDKLAGLLGIVTFPLQK